MLKIIQWKDLNTLPVTPTLLDQLKQHLLAPFNDENEAQLTWIELECELWMLSSMSGVCVDSEYTPKNEKKLLSFALENIEFEVELDPLILLTLTIINDSGQGLYLLMSKSLKAELMCELGLNESTGG
ncbi:hypothetical protein MO387_20675 [Shewanella sp. N2AIL]|uniref:hypothetical protein n=1 Tax=Shewanella sp. N2AIL TaxID=2926851 RepID=UPI001F578573|nr:hypothetical protein [Shewanella sp. N2AIL]MCI2965465.1 hypothetical protein [Shewanella sp. N2AIL]